MILTGGWVWRTEFGTNNYLLFEFGDFAKNEDVLGNLNIVKNPTYKF